MSVLRPCLALVLVACVTATLMAAQRAVPAAIRNFLKVDAAVVALVHVRVIDGTGAPARDDQTLVIRDGNIAAIGSSASTAVPPECDGDRWHGQDRDARARDAARALLLPDRPERLRPARPELHAPVSRRWRDDDADRRQRERGDGHHARADERVWAAGGAGDRRDGAIPQRSEHVPADARARRRRRRAAAGELLGRRWARRRSRRTCRSRAHSSARRSTRRTSAGSRSPVICARSLTPRRRLSASTTSSTDSWPPPTSWPTSSRTSVPGQSAGQQTIAALDPYGEPFRALVKTLVDRKVALTSTLHGLRDVHARPADAAGPRRADAAASRAVRAVVRAHRVESRNRSMRRCFRR